MAAADPALRAQQPFKAVSEQDRAWLGALLEHVPELVKGVSEAFGGITVEAFEREVEEFFQPAKHPTLEVPYTAVTYRPMRELIQLLEHHELRVYICSAGGRDFVRVVSEEIYGIPRDRVIGTSAPLVWKDGALVRTGGVEQPIDDGAGKPVHIFARTGLLPVFAAGNADGDIEMLTAARFGVLVHHDDADREFAYDEGAEKALTLAKA